MAEPWPAGQLRAQVRHQVAVLMRTPRAITTGVVLPVLLLLLSDSTRGQLPPARLAGLAVLGLSMTAWTTHGIGLVAARESGVLKRWRATPLPRWCYFTGRIVATVVVAVATAAITVLTGIIFFGIEPDAGGVPVLAGILLLGAGTCAAVATALTAAVPNVASAFPVLGLTYLPIAFFSGAFGERGGGPHWASILSEYLPIAPTVDAAAHAMAGGSLPGRDLLVLMVWAAAGLLVSLVTFRWEPTRPRRRRTHKETL